MNPFDKIFGSDSRAVRRDGLYYWKTDKDGRKVVELVDESLKTLTPDGSFNSGLFRSFFPCGHVSDVGIGGKCAECSEVVCRLCFQNARCRSCHKPLCGTHLKELTVYGTTRRLCPACHKRISRRLRWRWILRGLFSPFITFDDRKSS
jgi:hypothetical protein